MNNAQNQKGVLISGASISGLASALALTQARYKVTIVEMAGAPRTAGAAVDIRDRTVESVKQLGIYEELKRHRLTVEKIEFKNAADETEGSTWLTAPGAEHAGEEIEIERDKFLSVMMKALDDKVEFIFNDSITALEESTDGISATFKSGFQRKFDLVIGCDGIHSGVRRIWFGPESDYAHFLNAYFSISISQNLLVPEKTMQMFNVPDRAVSLNAYNGKTDIIFCFYSEKEIDYNYRDLSRQRQIISEHFSGMPWRTQELLAESDAIESFYFDKFCQIKMSSWTKGRVALVGDAGYCASPAAGQGASLSISGAVELVNALKKHDGNHQIAFSEYNLNFRPHLEKVQAEARRNISDNFIPRTEEAIRRRNTQPISF